VDNKDAIYPDTDASKLCKLLAEACGGHQSDVMVCMGGIIVSNDRLSSSKLSVAEHDPSSEVKVKRTGRCESTFYTETRL
jgi:hypothetical protein